jgi:hypothetical protein
MQGTLLAADAWEAGTLLLLPPPHASAAVLGSEELAPVLVVWVTGKLLTGIASRPVSNPAGLLMLLLPPCLLAMRSSL